MYQLIAYLLSLKYIECAILEVGWSHWNQSNLELFHWLLCLISDFNFHRMNQHPYILKSCNPIFDKLFLKLLQVCLPYICKINVFFFFFPEQDIMFFFSLLRATDCLSLLSHVFYVSVIVILDTHAHRKLILWERIWCLFTCFHHFVLGKMLTFICAQLCWWE